MRDICASVCQRSLFNLDRTVLLYDLTNTHFEGLCERNPKAKRGANKQKRNDCPQVVVGMVFDQSGFEMTHKVFDGNLNDSKSLLHMIEEMNALVADDKKEPLVVMDGGIATTDTRAEARLSQPGYTQTRPAYTLLHDNPSANSPWRDTSDT